MRWACYVEGESQEARLANELNWEPPSAIGSARTTTTEMETMREGVGWMVQRAAQAASPNDSKQDR